MKLVKCSICGKRPKTSEYWADSGGNTSHDALVECECGNSTHINTRDVKVQSRGDGWTIARAQWDAALYKACHLWNSLNERPESVKAPPFEEMRFTVYNVKDVSNWLQALNIAHSISCNREDGGNPELTFTDYENLFVHRDGYIRVWNDRKIEVFCLMCSSEFKG